MKVQSSIWEDFTLLEKEEQGLAVFFSFTGEDKQAVRIIGVKTLSSADGLKLGIEELDKLYLKDESSPAYEAYKKFEKFSRPHEISLSDYVTKFEQLHQVAENHDMEVLDGVLAYRLLNNANLPGKKIQLIQATGNKIKYKIMKEQLKKVFTRLSFRKRSREEAAKLEQWNTMKMFFTENQLLKYFTKQQEQLPKKKQEAFAKSLR